MGESLADVFGPLPAPIAFQRQPHRQPLRSSQANHRQLVGRSYQKAAPLAGCDQSGDGTAPLGIRCEQPAYSGPLIARSISPRSTATEADRDLLRPFADRPIKPPAPFQVISDLPTFVVKSN